ncbi:DUF3093 domain-containing protein [Kineococcus endophyticus]|uniref:DUF3093 domain-containing protein n=1 Tax=Kineococcus endophyticus TaxID=1181883 RepID=A0ABV3P4X5_9ACTN
MSSATSPSPSPQPSEGPVRGDTAWDGRETWWPAVTSWLSWLPAVVGGALVALPIWGTQGALVGAVVGAVLAVGVLLSLSWTTRLTETEFRVGRATLPLSVVSGVDVIARRERRTALGPGLDARAHLAIRSWIGPAVRIHLDDPADPTPYWVVSTRRPQRLAAEIRRRSRCR